MITMEMSLACISTCSDERARTFVHRRPAAPSYLHLQGAFTSGLLIVSSFSPSQSKTAYLRLRVMNSLRSVSGL